MTGRRILAALVLSLMCAGVARAQTAEAVSCETQANRRKAAWATGQQSWLATMLELQARELELSRCRMRASSGEQQFHQAENYGRVLLTGEGVHPVVATITAGNGLAAGVAASHEWASENTPLRYAAAAQTRVSANRSWTAGALLNVVGSSPSPSNRHMHAIADGGYTHVAELSFFGVGAASTNEETRFGLNLGVGRFTLIAPAGGAFEFFGQVEGLHAAPGLGQATTYAVFGGGAGFHYPEDEVLTGYSTNAGIGVRRYQETAGRPYSFTRANVRWNNQYTPDTNVDAGTFSVNVRLDSTVASSTDQVPFYLMPTLGGADINGDSGLRSYHDYRFRAAHALVAQVEYAHAVRDPIGVFAFYDAGTVADRFGDLGRSVKHSVGVGLTVRLGGLVFGQLYYAFGGGEGTRFNFGGNTNPSTVDSAAHSAF